MTKDFGEQLFSSCKEVKFGTMNTRAIEFIGAGATNYEGIPLLGLDILMLNNKFIYLCVSYCICQNGLNLLG